MNMGNLNKLALTAQEALQQTIVIASENESSPQLASPQLISCVTGKKHIV